MRTLHGAPRRIESWFCINEAHRVGLTGLGRDDEGRIAYQASDGTYWRLLSTYPNSWQQVGAGTSEGGGGGGDDAYYAHLQSVAATNWVIAHNLGKKPSVTVVVGGVLTFGDVVYNDDNTLSIVFSKAVAGQAYLN